MSLGFLILTRDAGVRLYDLAGDVAALARPGDEVVLVDDGSRDDTLAWIGRATAMRGWGAGVRVTRIATAARGQGDLGIAANLALDAAKARHVLLLPGQARLDPRGFAQARARLEAEDLDLLAAPGAPSMHRVILRRALLETPRLRCDEGRAAQGDLRLLSGVAARALRQGRADQDFAHLPPLPPAGPALFAASLALLREAPERAGWLMQGLSELLDDLPPGAAAAARPTAEALALALPEGWQAVTPAPLQEGIAALRQGAPRAMRRLRPNPVLAAPPSGGAPLRIACEGPHARRTPFAYPALAPLWQDRIALTADPAKADLILWAHPMDLATARPEALREAGRKPLALVSEEPFWDTIFSPDPLTSAITLPGGLRLHQVNHHRSAIFDFDVIPYFLLTDHRFAPAYAHRFARNAALGPEDWRAAFARRPLRTVFMAERRPEAFHDVAFPEGDILGLCAWRTRLAEACSRGVERLGASWQGGPSRFDIDNWHLEKLVQLDGRARMISALENTHQPTYLSEKLFDAFACGAVPLAMASPGHRLHGLGLPEGAWINLWGLDSRQAAARVDAAEEPEFAAYAAAQQSLARLFGAPRIWLAERARLRATLWAEMARLADLGPA